jgi:hypothetical protein
MGFFIPSTLRAATYSDSSDIEVGAENLFLYIFIYLYAQMLML